MKNILGLLLLLFCIQSCDTRKSSPSGEYFLTLKQIIEDTKTVERTDSQQVKNVLYRLEATFRNLPVKAEQEDSLVWYVQNAFSYYYRISAIAREYPASLALMDSLAALHTPFLEAHARHDLFGVRINLNFKLGRMEQAVALADSLRQLPALEDGSRQVQYNSAAASVYHTTNQIQKAIDTFEQSVELYRKGVETDYASASLAWLGVLYNHIGRYGDASEVILEAIRFYETHPENTNTVVAYGEQANSYYEMGLIDKALEMNRKTIEVAKRNGNYNLADVYRFRAKMFQKVEQPDSMFYYYHIAENFSKQQKNKGGIWMSRLELADAYTEYPDSMAKVRPLIDTLCTDSADMPDYFRLMLNSLLGKAYMKSGQTKEAIREFEQGLKLAEEAEMYADERTMRSWLMEAYQQTGQNDRLAEGFKRFKYLTDSLNTDETKRLVASTNIRFETEKKEQENRLLTTEVELKDSRLHNYAFIGLSLLAIGLCIGAWLWMRQRSLRLRLRLEEQERELALLQLREQEENVRKQEERLQQILASRQELNRNNEELLRQLAEIQAANEKTCDLDRVMERLQPKLITTDEEEQFRMAFSTLYPTALHRLRTVCTRITRADELLCMLILLKQTNEEVSRTLGISRSSVLQNRYRLKQKLELPEGIELDSEVERIMLN